MDTFRRVAAVAVVVWLIAASVHAQDPGQKVRRWDADVSIGLWGKSGPSIDADESTTAEDRATGGYWRSKQLSVDIGRYWTPHLKTQMTVATVDSFTSHDLETMPFSGLARGASIFTEKRLSLQSINAGATYQFLEDRFAHPYVTAGLQLGWLRTHRYRASRDYSYSVGPFPAVPVRYTVPALDEHTDRLLIRPAFAAGAKLYFNRRVYARPEVSAAVGRRGFVDWSGRAGFGFDF